MYVLNTVSLLTLINHSTFDYFHSGWR